MALKSGPMDRSIKEITIWAVSMEKGNTPGKTVLCSPEIGKTTKLMAEALTIGLMGASTSANGRITTCMGRASTSGKMAGCIRAPTCKIGSTVMACTNGPMVASMTASGRTEDSMERGSTGPRRAAKLGEASGSKANATDG